MINFRSLVMVGKILGHTSRSAKRARRKLRRSGTASQYFSNECVSNWAVKALRYLNVECEVKGNQLKDGPVMFVGNHMSYLDIPLFLAAAEASFVAKHSISRWPVVGKAAKSSGTIFVKRASGASKVSVRGAVKRSITNEGKSVCVFPAGGTSLKEDIKWKRGAFHIAKECGIPVQPFRVSYSDNSTAAYVGRDNVVAHVMKMARLKAPLKATIEFGEPFLVDDPTQVCFNTHQWCRVHL